MAVTVEQHAALVASLITPAIDGVGVERMPLVGAPGADALGRVTASAVFSPVDLPLFRNSQMDGFAVRAADVPGELPIDGVIPATPGIPSPLRPGTAVRIMTGAPVPDGADAVVPVEETTVAGGMVSITTSPAAGTFVRERGSDVRAGDLMVSEGRMLASRHLAALAAAGITDVEVRRRVRVAIVTTGAELLEPGTPALPGQVYDSNSVALVAAIRACGAEVTLARRVIDDPALLLAVLDEAASVADMILTSGGISHGDFEVVRELLEPRGAVVGHVAMQPGGPQATARFEGVPVICFPGNPVSTQLSFEVFVAPLLRAAAGLPAPVREHRVLVADLTSVPGKRQFLRGRALREAAAPAAGAESVDGADPARYVDLVAGPGSHLVVGLAASDVLVVVPEDVTSLRAGDSVETWAL